MKITVCIKQVPGAAKVEIDPFTGVMKRDTAEAKLNPHDLYAIEEALKLSEATGGVVTALSMGPPQAREALLEALYMGADHAALLSGKAFAGSDVLATSYALSQAAKLLGFDIIICGKQTTDGDTAQVGAELAEFLGIPHAANVLSMHAVDMRAAWAGAGAADSAEAYTVEAGGAPKEEGAVIGAVDGEGNDADDGAADGTSDGAGKAGSEPISINGLLITVSQDDHIITQLIPLPCLVCVDGGANTPRLPSYKRKRALAPDAVRLLSLKDLDDKDEKHYGLTGSPTQVEKTYTPDSNAPRETITGDGGEVAARLAAVLSGMKYIRPLI